MAIISLNTATDGLPPEAAAVQAPAADAGASAAPAPSVPANDGQPPAGSLPPAADGPPPEYTGADAGFLEKVAKELENPPEAKEEAKPKAEEVKSGDAAKVDPPVEEKIDDPEIDKIYEAQLKNVKKEDKLHWKEWAQKSKVTRRDLRLANDLIETLKSDLYKARAASPEDVAGIKAQLEQERTSKKEIADRLRILDIQQDPDFIATYDAPIQRNEKAMEAAIREFAKRGNLDDKATEAAIADYRKAGYSTEVVGVEIMGLEKTGKPEDFATAQKLRALLQNSELIRSHRTAKMEEWKTDGEARKTRQQAEQADRQTKATKDAEASFAENFTSENKPWVDKFSFLAQPPAPDAKDPADVRMAKQADLDAWTAARAKADDAIKGIAQDLQNPQKSATAAGRARALMADALMKDWKIARFDKTIAQQQKRISELEAEVGKGRKAGSLSTGHVTAPAGPKKAEPTRYDQSKPEGSFLKAYAEANGVNV